MQIPRTLESAGGLRVELADDAWRVGWGETDWLGPLGFALHHHGRWFTSRDAPHAETAATRVEPQCDCIEGTDDLGGFHGVGVRWSALPFPLRTTVRAYADMPVIVFRLEAPNGAGELATRLFAQPSVAWPTCAPRRRRPGGAPDGLRTYGHQYTEFALPVNGDADANGFFFAPHRPPVTLPLLLIAPDGRTLLLAPLDHFHEQVIAVPADRAGAAAGIRCGWHGDLAQVPAGFATELALWAADGPRAALDAWAAFLRRRHHTRRPSRYADVGVGALSYWTDNGAAYYYRTAPGDDYLTTLEQVVADQHRHDIPIRSLQFDSWFYPQQHLRPVSAEGAPIVPPSGMLKWEPRTDLFPQGFGDLQRRLALPLTFHSRHFSSQSPYFEQHAAWVDGEYAHPADSRLGQRLLSQAAAWGAVTYEQDWMVESFLGVRGLRELPGRARAWQEGLDHAAGELGLTLQWCMASPADFLQTLTLEHVTSIRTSGDYRYLFDNGLGWVWFLHGNALARALGLNAFKDVFISHAPTRRGVGEPYAEAEALLAGLSAGPVAIGDQLGCGNREIIMRTCREDGVLIKPDVPIAAVDRCFRANSFLEASALIGETYSQHPAGRWIYVASFNACRAQQPLPVRVDLADLGPLRPQTPVLAYNWRERTWRRLEPDGHWECTLAFQDWEYQVICPLLPGALTVFGDVGKYATVGDRRIAHITATGQGIAFDVLGVPASWITVHGYAAAQPHAVRTWSPGQPATLPRVDPSAATAAEGEPHPCWSWDARNGGWVIRANAGPTGRVHVALHAG